MKYIKTKKLFETYKELLTENFFEDIAEKNDVDWVFQYIENILENDDIDLSIGDIQDIINQTDGDDAGMFFSDEKYNNIDDQWKTISHKYKNKILLDYIQYEKSMNKTFPDKEQSISEEQLEILEYVFLYINNNVNTNDLDKLGFSDYHIDFLDKKIDKYIVEDNLDKYKI